MKFLKKISPFRIIVLIILLAGNTFAWFIYTTKIESNIQVHVKSWNVVFRAGDDEVSSNINVNVDSIYPGMENYTNEVTAYNKSDLPATLTYTILEANILGDEYITKEGRGARLEEPVDGDKSSKELVDILKTNYPFRIVFTISNNIVDAENGEEKYSFNVIWPYEQNNDSLDTYWGVKAAEYKNNNPDIPSITIKVKLTIVQNPN